MRTEQYRTYEGNDLGAVYTPERTVFRVWAPGARQVKLLLYPAGNDTPVEESCVMEADEGDTWYLVKEGDCSGRYYTYLVTDAKGRQQEAVDPYARAVGVNGQRGMVVDLSDTDPAGFSMDSYRNPASITDAVIYEASVRDLTIDGSGGVVNRGKYLGLTETGTKNGYGEATGLDHICDLGVTHVQLMPAFDFETVDERRPLGQGYNWGYDPDNYNAPEGSYSTNPFEGEVRVREMKEMVQALHDRGIGVVMDVVYNHTYRASDSNLNKLAPGYYYRTDEDGVFSNGSGCGNELASDRAMTRKLIIDSLAYWMTEYHIDGFRFDLMAVLDIETMQAVERTLRSIRPDVFLYGEGWNGGASLLEPELAAWKCNMKRMPGIGAFNDDIRDAVKGSVFEAEEQGFVNGGEGCEEGLRFGIAGAVEHPQVDYEAYGKPAWALSPEQSINYVSCHDNFTLWDKLAVSCPDADETLRKRMNRLAAAIIFTSQGVPFLQAGEEFLRSKPSPGSGTPVEDSYNMPDETNSLKWDQIHTHRDMVTYYRGLMEFRRAHGLLRLREAQEVREALTFLENVPDGVVAYELCGVELPETDRAAAGGMSAAAPEETFPERRICVIFNGRREPVTVELPEAGRWSVYINADHAGADKIFSVESNAVAEPVSAMVLIKE